MIKIKTLEAGFFQMPDTNSVQQRTPEWFAMRVGKITGSRIGSVLGVNPYKSRADLLQEMALELNGISSDFKGNKATRHGELHEPVAVNAYQQETGNSVLEQGIILHREYSFLAYSPDGLVTTQDGTEKLLEIKCPYSNRIPHTIPAYYKAQVQLGMEVMGLPECDFYYWTKGATRLTTGKRSQPWFESVLPELLSFNEQLLELSTRIKNSNTAN